jgi:hypothetical protein
MIPRLGYGRVKYSIPNCVTRTMNCQKSRRADQFNGTESKCRDSISRTAAYDPIRTSGSAPAGPVALADGVSEPFHRLRLSNVATAPAMDECQSGRRSKLHRMRPLSDIAGPFPPFLAEASATSRHSEYRDEGPESGLRSPHRDLEAAVRSADRSASPRTCAAAPRLARMGPSFRPHGHPATDLALKPLPRLR